MCPILTDQPTFLSTIYFLPFLYITGGAGQYLGTDSAAPDPNLSASAVNGMVAMANANRKLQVSTWNVAAINNNPFEYWITYDENPAYEKIMTDIETFLENPGDQDVPVSQVFTEEMFAELEKRMDSVGWDNVRSYWDNDFKNRKIIKDFMKVSEFEEMDELFVFPLLYISLFQLITNASTPYDFHRPGSTVG